LNVGIQKEAIMAKFLRWLAIGVGFAALSSPLSASQCSGPGGVIESYNICVGQPACDPNFYKERHPDCFGTGGNTAAGVQRIVATSFQQMLAIASALGARNAAMLAPPGTVAGLGAQKGVAAGGTGQKWNVWANIGEADQKFDRGTYVAQGDATNTARTNRFDSSIQNVVLGGDFQVAPAVAIGLSAAFDNGNGTAASYALATPDAARSVSTSGTSIAPYVGWQINKDWALDASMGWGSGKSTVGGTIKSDSTRYFFGANLGYTTWVRNWQLTGKGGYLFGEEKYAGTNDNGVAVLNSTVKNRVGQFRLSGQAAYWMDGFMPYAGVALAADSRSSSADAGTQDATAMGKNAWIWSLGANFISLRNNLTGGIAYELESGRSRAKSDRLMANINYRF
jgi:hypothetical protein